MTNYLTFRYVLMPDATPKTVTLQELRARVAMAQGNSREVGEQVLALVQSSENLPGETQYQIIGSSLARAR